MRKLLLDFPAAVMIFFSPFRELQGFEMNYNINDKNKQNTLSKNKKAKTI